MDKIMEIASNFILVGEKYNKLPMSVVEKNIIGVANIVFGVAILVLLITGMILGLKYMIAGADERGELKQKLVWYVVAAILVFSATGIYNLIVNIIMVAVNS